MSNYLEIAVPVGGLPNLLTYSVPKSILDRNLVGKRVHVTVGRRQVVGVVIHDKDIQPPAGIPIRDIQTVLDEEPVITREQIELCKFVSDYYFSPLGEVIRLCLPPGTPRTLKTQKLAKRVKKNFHDDNQTASSNITLTIAQQHAVEAIVSSQNAFLLQGVTGSGKTEVYITVARTIFAQNQSILIIVPEIALTPQLLHRFESQLSTKVYAIHSGMTSAHRREIFFELLKPIPHVVVGTRSALFSPAYNLGLIVVDEEHDSSLKQDDTPRYHARDVALWRAKNEHARIILGSATPSLESMVNVERGKLELVELKERALTNSTLPNITVVDLKSRSQHSKHKWLDRAQSDGQRLCILSKPLQNAIADTLARGEQVMLFLNRRGYASFVLCDSCGTLVQCPFCSTSMSYSQQHAILRCHQCDFTQNLPESCPSCHEPSLIALGLGTERVEKEIKLAFPDARIARLDRDVVKSHQNVKSILSDMDAGHIDILIGTQMIAKGHDFSGVSLVGVIMADTGLAMPDFRASERTFQLLTQVAGRAGRREKPGQVIIQTFNPNHPSIEFARKHDVNGFMKLEYASRKAAKQPPFARSALLRIESRDSNKAAHQAKLLHNQIAQIIKKLGIETQCNLLGPAPAPIERLREHYRWQLYLRTTTTNLRKQIICYIIKNKVKTAIDIDPQTMI